MNFKTRLLASVIGMLVAAPAVAAPKNIIYMIGDGMGPTYTTAYRYFKDDPATKVVEPTVFDSILVGMAHTYPDDDTIVTDSAAGATALSTGTKSYNGAIAVDTHKAHLETMLEVAKKKGKTTALVATSQINHATPASFASHNESRRNYDEIANDYVDNKIAGKLPVDLMLGGGTKYFIREDRNLVNEFKEAGYQYVDDLSKLDTLNKVPAIGLFAEVGLPFAIDEEPQRLTKMTQTALSLLENQNDKGFFLMVEGSQIDWCGHANDIACAMREMDDFAESIKLAKAFVDSNPDTILVVTADHSTGGLTLGANGQYRWERDVIANVKGSAGEIAKALVDAKDVKATWKALTGLEYDSATELNVKEALSQGPKALSTVVKETISDASFTGWTTSGHTAIDVPVFAHGMGKERFIGSQNNTKIADKLIEFIKK
ncbi:alkaline phosphatase [Pseudoalteromonas peptidolytica]|uniref:Alkaline phosphatase n=1 Tax=Pseudoalteromonas peptidolytica F12-50-A1 TaxID=1315280 RepID=A0A8I0N0P6_9GAMM|nr:alkaline phosphatase [Pseudoalteromonas peptidolytica]MBE0348763.1 alkaline phosphatase [Pseudoalteromonas peptidolytica F12-50-A1]NLR15081.1 alkaline phosphatase [Pseudoalteromonas peptidolytica]GEK09383.1 alkaline phosphatase [Pseudoalteromonas peptidolytica]